MNWTILSRVSVILEAGLARWVDLLATHQAELKLIIALSILQ
jgi:hypothetical protein